MEWNGVMVWLVGMGSWEIGEMDGGVRGLGLRV